MDEPIVRDGETEQIQVLVRDSTGSPLIGKTDLFVKLRRDSDGQFLDWSDITFKAAGHTTINKILTEVDATNIPGLYEVTSGIDTGAITNPASDDRYIVAPLQTPGTDALIPSPGAFRVGRWVGDIVLMRKKHFNRREINIGSQVEELYDDDSATVLGSQPLTDANGGAVVALIGAPGRIGKFS